MNTGNFHMHTKISLEFGTSIHSDILCFYNRLLIWVYVLSTKRETNATVSLPTL